MVKDELQQHLDRGRYGTPQINPQEQRIYMGTFRERCYVSMTIQQMQHTANQVHLVTEMEAHPEAQLLLNGAMSSELQSIFIQLATKYQQKFTIVNDAVENTPDSFGLLLVAKTAVNEPVIDIEKKYANPQNHEPLKEKKSFWKKLF